MVVLLVIALLAFFSLFSMRADAQPMPKCGLRGMIVERLSDRFSETRQSLMLAANGVVIELFASRATGTWTILSTRPDGLSCLIASGGAFEDIDEPAPLPGDDT